ncbi:hypothetical protein SAMN04487760_11521 [Lachnospiraceae bacterium G41]|nr:hypothetical protein SAMN04487760_11521 [Lachnospiraceae bacterium G41]
MKRGFKKFGAFLLVAAMTLAMNSTVFAAKTLDDNGEQGVFTSKDTPAPQSKTLILEKEIKAYNVDGLDIKAPTISYTYSIAPATVTAGTEVTDSDKSGTIHDTGVTVTVPVQAGPAGASIANSGVLAWTNSDTLETATDGKKNVKDISIDFSQVVFAGAGVYRYEITEQLTSGYAYASSGVTETSDAANGHKRFVDVYVRPANPTPSGKTAADPEYWDIYGYTCFYNNTSITEANKGTSAVKTTGFVQGTTNGSTAVTPDSYYTFNVVVNKTVENDSYSAANNAFPFTVIYTNSSITKDIDIESTTSGTVTGWTDPTASAMSDGNTNHDLIKGIVNIKSGGEIKYIGIPNGTSVEVYETNNATGATYKVVTVLTTSTTATTTDNSVDSHAAPASAVAQGNPKNSYESTKATFSTAANQDDDNPYEVAITNTLLTISPTGFVVRFAPYALVLFGGIFLIVLGVVLYKRTNKEEA